MMATESLFYLLAPHDYEGALLVNYLRLDNLNQLPKEGSFSLVLDITQEGGPCIQEIRQDKRLRFTPVFYLGEPDVLTHDLYDGLFNTTSRNTAQYILSRIKKIPTNNKEPSEEQILLGYLYTRPDMLLRGYSTFQKVGVFTFPLVEALINSVLKTDVCDYIQDLVNRELLNQKRLVNEIQTCPGCRSGLLNFKNCCPSCSSIDIKTQTFVHCFACGNIATVSECMKNERLVCPRCQAKLRHIGIDYDKPLEDKLCNQCDLHFMDSQIRIICLVCARSIEPEALVTRMLYDYTPSRRGERLALGEEIVLENQLKHLFDFLDFNSFMSIVSWQIKLVRRHETIHFCLLSLTVRNEDLLIAEQGVLAFEKVTEELYTRIRSVLRNTDLATRKEGITLFYLPMTDNQGGTILKNRVRQFVSELSSVNNESNIMVGVSFISSKDILEQKIDDSFLIPELLSRMDSTDD